MKSHRQVVMDAVGRAPSACSMEYLEGNQDLMRVLGNRNRLSQTLANLVAAKRLVRVQVHGVSMWDIPRAAEVAEQPSEPLGAPTTPEPVVSPLACPPTNPPTTPSPPTPVEVPSILPAIDQLVEQIVRTVVAGLETALPAAIEVAVAQRVQETLKTLPERILSAVPTKPKTKVLVVGLLPGLAKQIDQEFADAFDMRFVEAQDHGSSRLRSLASGSAHTILMADFISHKHTESVTSTGVKPVVISGGLTKLRDKLTELYANE